MKGSIIALAFISLGCAPQEPQPDPALIEALVELQLAQARQQLVGDVRPELRDSVLSQYGFDAASLKASLNALETNLEHANATYSAVVDSLNARGIVTSETHHSNLQRR